MPSRDGPGLELAAGRLSLGGMVCAGSERVGPKGAVAAVSVGITLAPRSGSDRFRTELGAAAYRHFES